MRFCGAPSRTLFLNAVTVVPSRPSFRFFSISGKPKNTQAYHAWRCALILHGVDMSGNHGGVSAVHGEREIEETITAVGRAVADLKADGLL